MKEIQLTKNKVALVDDELFDWLNQWRWHVTGRSILYAQRSICSGGKRAAIRMHRQILNPPKELDIDHINGNGLDNRKINLRTCTRQENKRNGNSHRDSTSKFKGVSWLKKLEKWCAQIWYNEEKQYLGLFLNETDAALAYNKKAIELFGEFAKLNKIIK